MVEGTKYYLPIIKLRKTITKYVKLKILTLNKFCTGSKYADTLIYTLGKLKQINSHNIKRALQQRSDCGVPDSGRFFPESSLLCSLCDKGTLD